jgi:DNA-binding transcriptional regulator YdaS (Cro superfamily)
MRWFEKAQLIRKSIRPKMTYEKMAPLLNVSRSTVHAWLSGRNAVTPEEVEAIAKVLGVSQMELLSGDAYWLRDDEEKAWISYWRSLPDDQRQALAKTLGVIPVEAQGEQTD